MSWCPLNLSGQKAQLSEAPWLWLRPQEEACPGAYLGIGSPQMKGWNEQVKGDSGLGGPFPPSRVCPCAGQGWTRPLEHT